MSKTLFSPLFALVSACIDPVSTVAAAGITAALLLLMALCAGVLLRRPAQGGCSPCK